MTDTPYDILNILRKDDISRKPQTLEPFHHIPCISGSSGNDQIGLERNNFLKIEADVTSHPDLALHLFRKVTMDRDTYDLSIEAQAEEDLGNVGS